MNSSATGRYADYVAEELVSFVDQTYPTLDGARRRLRQELRRGSVPCTSPWGIRASSARRPRSAATATSSCPWDPRWSERLAPSFPTAATRPRWLEEFSEKHDLGGDGHAAINVLAMSACYAPNPESPLGFDLPFDPETCARRADVWARFLAFDPVEAAREHTAALQGWTSSTSRRA